MLVMSTPSLENSVPARPSKPPLPVGDVDRLATVAGAEFADRGAEVVPHRAFGEVQRGGDVRGGVVAGRGGENLVLAWSERALPLLDGGGGQGRVDGRGAGRDCANRRCKLACRRGLEQEAPRCGCQSHAPG